MEKYGFQPYFGEWWHFSDSVSYPVEENFCPVAEEWYLPDCQEYISLRPAPDTGAEALTRIPVGEAFRALAWEGDFALVEYQNQRGYVLRSYIQSAGTLWQANCEEFISLRETPGGDTVLEKIPVGGTMELLDWEGKYARVSYGNREGYVLSSYIMPVSQPPLSVVEFTAAYSHEQLLEDLDQLHRTYPALTDLEELGTSEQGRSIPVLRIGSPEAEHHVLLQGAIHGREHMTAWLLAALADYWLENGIEAYGGICWHIIPMTNPDGVAVSQAGCLDEGQRKIYREDLAQGYTSLGEAEYAALWKANGLGTDLNRNFDAGWEAVEGREAPSAQRYPGEAPFSAQESKLLRDYTQRYEFDITLSYHAHGCILYCEYGQKPQVNERSRELALAVEAVTGYGLGSSEDVDGAGYKDWAMDALEIPSLTVEIGCGSAPLEERELFSTFARNRSILPALAGVLEAWN